VGRLSVRTDGVLVSALLRGLRENAGHHRMRDEAMHPEMTHPEMTQSQSARSSAGGATPTQADRPAQLRELAHGALRCAVRGAQPDAAPGGAGGELGDALRRTCDTARDGGVRVEELLLILKEGWRYLPEAQRLERRDADAALTRAVTLCIREYYQADQRS
jgi:hypothetical protein